MGPLGTVGPNLNPKLQLRALLASGVDVRAIGSEGGGGVLVVDMYSKVVPGF